MHTYQSKFAVGERLKVVRDIKGELLEEAEQLEVVVLAIHFDNSGVNFFVGPNPVHPTIGAYLTEESLDKA